MDLLPWFTNFLIKISATRADRSAANTSGGVIKSEIMLKQQLADIHKPTIRRAEKRKLYSFVKDNI